MKMSQTANFWFAPGSVRYEGLMDRYVRFAMEHQLMNEKTWQDFVAVFRADSDDRDNGWRGEYWGKMMRGACLTYRYNRDEGLYSVLEHTVRQMLETQRSDGRFSTYSRKAQLHGWDMWGRKYILTSMLHFHDICRDESLKKSILDAMCAHMDAILELVGPEEGKIPITKTSHIWGGVNSASILDAVIDLYRHTGKADYLSFAEYILSTGGCEDGNLIELALENRKMPYEYPTVKAYETMSFFEGVLSYYEVTGQEKYLRAVLNFVEAVNETDITVIGCSGCTHELFDNSAKKQVLYSDGIMQETCVTVTWMRLLAKLFLLRGDAKYMDRMERSAYNALYGSVNTRGLKQFSMEEKAFVDPLPFDSYSPLYNGPRGVGIGGFKRFAFGGYYGCCACIASAGIAVMPLCAATWMEGGISINSFASGTVTIETYPGNPLTVQMQSDFPASPEWSAQLTLKKQDGFTIRIRIPEYLHRCRILVNGEDVEAVISDGYASIYSIWDSGDTVRVTGCFDLEPIHVEGKTAFTYGPLVLARDQQKEACCDLTAAIQPAGQPKMLEPKGNETIRLELPLADGGPLLLTDYASCGKNWLDRNARIGVWMQIRGEEGGS